MHPRVGRTVKLLSFIFKSSWLLGEDLQDWENIVSHQFLKWIRKRIRGTTDYYRNIFQTHERQERGWWGQPTLVWKGQITSDESYCFLLYKVNKVACVPYLGFIRPVTWPFIVYFSPNWGDMSSASRWWMQNWLNSQIQGCDRGAKTWWFNVFSALEGRAVLEGSWTGWRNRLTGTSWRFQREMEGLGPGENQQPHGVLPTGAS